MEILNAAYAREVKPVVISFAYLVILFFSWESTCALGNGCDPACVIPGPFARPPRVGYCDCFLGHAGCLLHLGPNFEHRRRVWRARLQRPLRGHFVNARKFSLHSVRSTCFCVICYLVCSSYEFKFDFFLLYVAMGFSPD